MFAVKPITAQRVVTAAGTPEKIKEAPEYDKNAVISITIRANLDNAGLIFLTNTDDRASASTVGYKLAAGDILSLKVSEFPDAYINLAELWIDAENNGDGISYLAFEVLK